MEKRRITPVLLKDLAKKMVMLAGPRQCGKTTLSKMTAKKSGWKWSYYNWDIDANRHTIMKSEMDAGARLWILDELHKFRRWRNWLKGIFDEYHPTHHIFVTGSAQLETYSRGGDSLQGRYYLHHLHPYTLAELTRPSTPFDWKDALQCESQTHVSMQKTLQDLLDFGGFPEPYHSQSAREAGRWRLAYGSRIVRDEIRSLEQVQNLDGMELLLDRLPVTVGSTLSINSLKEDLQVSFETVRNWLKIFERLYAVMRIPPFGAPRIKAVKKEQKLYFWDWGRVENESSRFENLVAIHLLALVHWQQDVEGEKWELRYFRDKQGHEVDFLILRKNGPLCAIEVKLDDRPLDPNLKYFLERVRVPYAFQISLNGTKDFKPPAINGCQIRILPAAKFLSHLV